MAAVERRRPRRGGDSPDMEGAFLLLLDVRQAACPGIISDQPTKTLTIFYLIRQFLELEAREHECVGEVNIAKG